jgi:hypothetical protein
MTIGDRLTIAAIATGAAVPPGVIALVARVIAGIPTDSIANATPWLVWLAIWVAGSAWTYEIVSRITGGQLDRHRFSAGAVGIGTMAGALSGILFHATQTLLDPLVLALAGGVVGTYWPAKEPLQGPEVK